MAKLDVVIRVEPIVVKPGEKLILSIVKPPPDKEDLKWLVKSLEELFEGDRKFLVINGHDAIDYYVIMKEASAEVNSFKEDDE